MSATEINFAVEHFMIFDFHKHFVNLWQLRGQRINPSIMPERKSPFRHCHNIAFKCLMILSNNCNISKNSPGQAGQGPNNKQKVNLFCLPFAGASVYSYKDLAKHVADFIDVIPIELSGRGRRCSEALPSGLHEVIDDVFLQVKTCLGAPYALFGHSLGALLGFLLTKRILAEKLPQPLHLFFTGRSGPAVRDKNKMRHV